MHWTLIVMDRTPAAEWTMEGWMGGGMDGWMGYVHICCMHHVCMYLLSLSCIHPLHI